MHDIISFMGTSLHDIIALMGTVDAWYYIFNGNCRCM